MWVPTSSTWLQVKKRDRFVKEERCFRRGVVWRGVVTIHFFCSPFLSHSRFIRATDGYIGGTGSQGMAFENVTGRLVTGTLCAVQPTLLFLSLFRCLVRRTSATSRSKKTQVGMRKAGGGWERDFLVTSGSAFLTQPVATLFDAHNVTFLYHFPRPFSHTQWKDPTRASTSSTSSRKRAANRAKSTLEGALLFFGSDPPAPLLRPPPRLFGPQKHVLRAQHAPCWLFLGSRLRVSVVAGFWD